MKLLLQLISLVGLLLTIVPSLLYFTGSLSLSTQQWLMFIGTLLWFSTAPFWMNKR
ncbi:MAG: hypothetical protein RIG62_04600 [Cyclobacteriaceae bacterium]